MKKKINRIVNTATMQMKALPGLKPYNIIQNDEDVEIIMYGEVVETVPIDWWTGEPIDGLFIVLSDFLRDLDGLKNKNNVTVRINSIGGDLFAGVSIYNRLKELNNVTTIVDGLAASAASIIAQAAADGQRKIYESGQIMVHGASIGLFDYFNTQQLSGIMDQLEAANESVINVYAERTGEPKTKLKHMVEKTTWMTGQNAVEQGFADEVISGKVAMSMSSDRSLFLCNGIPMNARRLPVMPEGVQVIQTKSMQTATAEANKKSHNEGGNKMTAEEMRQQYPDVVKQIEDAAKNSVDTTEATQEAIASERQRIKDIESIEESIADKSLVEQAKYGEKTMDAKDLAFVAMQKQAQLGNTFLANNSKDVKDSGTEGVIATPNSGSSGEEKPNNDEADIMAAVNAVNKARGGK